MGMYSSGEHDEFKRTYPCDLCQKSYIYKQDLKRHMQVHTGQYTYTCAQCGKGFSDKRRYTDHMRVHAGLKYRCEFCAKPFISNTGYRDHLKQHTNYCGNEYENWEVKPCT